VRPEARPRAAILEAARVAGLSDCRAEKLLKSALACEYLFAWKEGGANSKTLIAMVKQPEPLLPPKEAPPAKKKPPLDQPVGRAHRPQLGPHCGRLAGAARANSRGSRGGRGSGAAVRLASEVCDGRRPDPCHCTFGG
jgi:hypothetical protein